MSRHPHARLAALATALLLVSALVASGSAAGVDVVKSSDSNAIASVDTTDADSAGSDTTDADSTGSDAVDDATTPPTRCFAGDGYHISIGETGATIDAVVHLSVLTDPSAGNEFGLEAAGALDGDPIVTLAAGVRLTAREAVADGIDPLAAFDVLYAYELDLPMFGGMIGDSEYSDEGSPLESGAGTVSC